MSKTAEQPTTVDEPSPGAILRAARENQGMHIAALAAAIKVSPRKLEALEEDRWDDLPGSTFTRALAQAVCRTLKVDARPVLELLPPADTSMLDSRYGSLNEPFNGHDAGDAASWRTRAGLLIAAAAVLVLAALALVALPPGLWSRLAGVAMPGAASGVAQVPAAPPATPASTAGESMFPPPAATAPAAVAAASPVPAAASAPSPAAQGAAALAPLPAADPTAALQIKANASSWVEVRDGRGRVLVSRTLAAGDRLGINGQPPLSVWIGNASATELRYRGQPIDLAGRSRENVARFELL